MEKKRRHTTHTYGFASHQTIQHIYNINVYCIIPFLPSDWVFVLLYALRVVDLRISSVPGRSELPVQTRHAAPHLKGDWQRPGSALCINNSLIFAVSLCSTPHTYTHLAGLWVERALTFGLCMVFISCVPNRRQRRRLHRLIEVETATLDAMEYMRFVRECSAHTAPHSAYAFVRSFVRETPTCYLLCTNKQNARTGCAHRMCLISSTPMRTRAVVALGQMRARARALGPTINTRTHVGGLCSGIINQPYNPCASRTWLGTESRR